MSEKSDREKKSPTEVRWSAKRKQELVLRLFRGESLDGLSRETGLPVSRIAAWRDASLAGMEGALKSSSRRDVETSRERAALERKLGELLMTNELLEEKMRRLQGRPFPPGRSKK
jgi:transposase-like protein